MLIPASCWDCLRLLHVGGGLSSDVAAVEIDLSSHLFLRNRHFTNFLSGYMLWKQNTVLWTLVLNCPSLRG